MRMTSNTCHHCAGVLIDEPLPEYNGELDDTDRPAWLEYDGTKYFIRCKECSATNLLVVSRDPIGTPVLTVTRAIMDDE